MPEPQQSSEQELQTLRDKLARYGSKAIFTPDEKQTLINAGHYFVGEDYTPDLTWEEKIIAAGEPKGFPNWTAPFHMPQFNEAEYLEAKAEYTARNGYTVTVPALSDIFHFGKIQPMSSQEKIDWIKKDWSQFSEARFEELSVDKQHKKERMMQMMGSPTPEVFAKLGAILTAVDDAQDAISTLAAIARLSRKIAPKLLGKILSGPVGLMLTVNDILNLITALGSGGTFAGFGKKTKDILTGSNPFSKKAKVKRFQKAMSWKPTFDDIIQAAQTTDQIFGVGVSLGPIVGFAQDLFHGMIKQSVGMEVNFKFSPHSVPECVKTSFNVIKSSSPFLAMDWNSPDDDILLVMQGLAMAHETIMPYQRRWNALDRVEGIEGALIHCPVPTHPTTLAAMEELNIDVMDVIGWPIIDKIWASPDELTETYAPRITRTVRKFIERHKHDSMGVLACSIVTDSAFYQMANLVGEENVEYDYTVPSKLASALLMANIIPLPVAEQTEGAMRITTNLINKHEALDQPFKANLFKRDVTRYDFWSNLKFYPSP